MIRKKDLFEFFKISPTPSLVLQTDAPKFTILEVNNAYLEATCSTREVLIGKGIFEAFPDNELDLMVDGVKNLSTSLTIVLTNKKSHKMATQKYDIPIRGTSEFELKYWNIENIPLLNEKGELEMIIHSVIDVTENILAQNKIKEARAIIDERNNILWQTESISKLCRWEFNLATKVVLMSDSFYQIMGYERSDLQLNLESITGLIHPDDRERAIAHLDETLKKQCEYAIELRFLSKNKSIIHIVSRGIFLTDDNGKIQKLIGVIQDITDIKLAQDQTKSTKEELQKILDLSLDIICTTDREGRFLTMNEVSARIFGYTAEEMIGRNYAEFVIQDDHQKSKEIAQKIYNGIEVTNFENNFVNKEGNLVTMFWSARWQEVDQTMYSVGKDITDVKIAQKQAKERQYFIETALENIPIGVSIYKIDEDKVIWMNKKFIEIYGWPEEVLNVVQTSFEKIYPDADYREEITARIMDDIKSGDTDRLNWEEISITTQEGEKKYINVKNIPLNDQNLMVSTVVDVTERKKALETIAESNERYEYVTRATFDAIWDWDLKTDNVYWGEGYERLFGYKINSLTINSSSWVDYIHPDDYHRVLESINAAIAGTVVNWTDEYRYTKANGSAAFVKDKAIIIRDTNGTATRMIGALQDISKQKEEEDRLKLLETVITKTNDAVVIKEAIPSTGLGRKITYVNEAFTRMTGYSRSEIIGKTSELLQGPNSDSLELERFYKALDEVNPVYMTIINYKKNGEEFWVDLSLNPVFNDLGEHLHWISIERDVTERKNKERKLAEISQKLLNTLESIQDGFYTLDNKWNVSYWNKAAEQISGKSQEEMLGKNFWEVYEGEISKTIYSKFHKAKQQNKPTHFEVFSKNNNSWFELNAFPSTMGLTIYFKDISERKQIESKLKKVNKVLETKIKELAISNEELEQFAYVASHDLQEPLRMVTSFLTQIENKYGNVLDEKGKKYIFFAVDGAKRMRQIILDLLEFSKIGKSKSNLEEINLIDIVDEIILLYGTQIKEKRAQINYENLPTLVSYKAPLKIIFQNLISNALKYSKSNSTLVINIGSKETSNAWEFIIQDNGIGIDSEYFEKIFVIFQRLHNKDEFSGTGMGLAITKKIIENLDGKIWLESEEGIGTIFHFTIPKNKNKQ